jgi:hypothetical protein
MEVRHASAFAALLNDVRELIHSALPLLGSDGQFRTEYQVRGGDGIWRDVTPEQAVQLHQQGVVVRGRKVTDWTGVEE